AGWLDAIGESQNIAPILAHATYDEFWHPVDLTNRGYEAVGVPGLHIGGWYDIFAQGTIDSFVGIEEMGGPGARGTQKLVIGPWTHAVFQQEQGDLTFPENATNWTDGDGYGDWFRHYLLGEENGAERAPAVTYYVMGDVDDPEAPGLEWRSTDRWPVASEPVPFYLHRNGSLSETPPEAGFSSTTYVYNPANPVPTLGGNNLLISAGPVDQRPVEDRSDVLLFTTGVFSEPIEITGRVSAVLYVSSSAVDTDFTVKLTDVYPDGRSILLLDGILRMRYREGFDREVFMEPGTIYEITVDLWSTSIVVNRGHRLRVAVSSSNAPRFDVNPNTGEPIGEATTMVVATQTLYHDARHPSRLILPVVE
ncbi:MAG: CocE/NonD family hydrolase, partial [Deltaproteobacteria bacterium]